jgi:DNA-binding SARP family transcriptional activator
VNNMLSLSLFGGFSLTHAEGTPIALDSDKTRALLAYLAVENEVAQRRSVLANLLWLEKVEKALGSPSQALHVLRKAVQSSAQTTPLFLNDPKSVQLNPHFPLSLDVHEFESALAGCAFHRSQPQLDCLVCMDELRQSVDLYRGNFLQGMAPADCPDFDAWLRTWARPDRRAGLAGSARAPCADRPGGRADVVVPLAPSDHAEGTGTGGEPLAGAPANRSL